MLDQTKEKTKYDRRGVTGTSNEDMLRGIEDEFRKCKEYRETNIEPRWKQMAQAYRAKEIEPSDDWMSKAPSTRLPIAVDLISAFTWQMFLQAGDAIAETDTSYTAGTSFGKFAHVEEQVRRELQRQMLAQLHRGGLKTAVLETLRSMLLYGTVGIKCPWQNAERLANFNEPKVIYQGRQELEMPIFPGYLLRDWTRTNRYEMSTYRISQDELVAMAEANPDVYDKAACKAAKPGRGIFGDESHVRLQEEFLQDSAGRVDDNDLVSVLEIWGGIPNEKGAIVRRFSWAAVVNGKFIVKPRYYGAWDAKPPLIIANQNPRPHEVWSIPWMYYFYHSGEALGSMRRAMIDKAQWVGRPLIAMYTGALDSRMTAGLFKIAPGELLEKTEAGDIFEVNQELSTINPQLFDMYKTMESDFAMSGHNELLHGGASPRGRTTAEEVMTRRTMLGSQQRFIILMLEDALSQVFTKTRNHILQYMPTEQWLDIGNALGDENQQGLEPEKAQGIRAAKQEFLKKFWEGGEIRYAMVNEPNMVVSGVTAAYKRTQESEALSSLFRLFFENPLALLAMGLDPGKIAEEFLWRIDGVDPDKLLLMPEDERQATISSAIEMVVGSSQQGANKPTGRPARAGATPTVATAPQSVQGRK